MTVKSNKSQLLDKVRLNLPCNCLRYNELFFMIDTCQAGSMVLPIKSPNIIGVGQCYINPVLLCNVRVTFSLSSRVLPLIVCIDGLKVSMEFYWDIEVLPCLVFIEQ